MPPAHLSFIDGIFFLRPVSGSVLKMMILASCPPSSLTLPHSEFLDQSHIRTVCTRPQLASQTCPSAAVYGNAEAVSPLLDGIPLHLGLVPQQVVEQLHVWQLVTYMFLHAGIFHILFNMLALWMFGVELEQMWGSRYFLKYYFVAGVGAAVTQILASFIPIPALQQLYYVQTVGASGAIFGVLLAYALYFPTRPIYIYFIFPIQAKYFVMIYGGIELLSAMNVNSGVSNVAHLGGMAFGFVYLKMRFPTLDTADVRRWYRTWKLERNKKKFQVYMRKHRSGRRRRSHPRRIAR